jgi:hypothetical protein
MMTTRPLGRLSARFALFAAVLLAASLSAACVTASPGQSARQTVRGTVRIVGNEPHTLVGIRAENGKTYGVLPVEKAAAIRALQGETADFIVIPDPSVRNPLFPDGTVKLLSWKIVK